LIVQTTIKQEEEGKSDEDREERIDNKRIEEKKRLRV
jgi:hypothetical protein